jgi:hypothetical protein
MTLEDGSKHWVGVWEKRDRNRERFMSVGLAAKQE